MLDNQVCIERIIGKLSQVINQVSLSNSINFTNINISSEMFYAELLNKLYKYNLKSSNALQKNSPAIDLIDDDNKLVVQVTSSGTKHKLQSSLDKLDNVRYNGYRFKLALILKNSNNLKNGNYNIKDGISFDAKDDIVSFDDIMRIVQGLELDTLKDVYNMVLNYLPDGRQLDRVYSNLAGVVNLLSESNLTEASNINTTIFDIQSKIDYNELSAMQSTIDNYVLYSQILDDKYAEFDKQGYNKSTSILNMLARVYNEISVSNKDYTSIDIFQSIIESMRNKVIDSSNYNDSLAIEELDDCLYIIIVDAFIRCKVFKNPTINHGDK